VTSCPRPARPPRSPGPVARPESRMAPMEPPRWPPRSRPRPEPPLYTACGPRLRLRDVGRRLAESEAAATAAPLRRLPPKPRRPARPPVTRPGGDPDHHLRRPRPPPLETILSNKTARRSWHFTKELAAASFAPANAARHPGLPVHVEPGRSASIGHARALCRSDSRTTRQVLLGALTLWRRPVNAGRDAPQGR